MKVTIKATMSVYKIWGNPNLNGIPGHRTDCEPEPRSANIAEGSYIFERLLGELQTKGVKPGTGLKITVETIRSKKKTER